MKRFLLLLAVVLILSPLLATQRFVVGEVFTATW